MEKKIKKFNKSTLFVRGVFISVLALSLALFLALSIYTRRETSDSITEASTFYMKGISEQMSMHFETTINLHLNQVESIIDSVSPDKKVDKKTLYAQLEHSAKVFSFTSLSLMANDGTIQTIYGRDIKLDDPDAFINAMNNGEKKAQVGTDSWGQKVVVLGASCVYAMDDENSVCTALVTTLPVDYFSDMLSLDVNGNKVYSFVLKENGDYVMHNEITTRDNYFDRVDDVYQTVDSKTTEQFKNELKEAMQLKEPYSGTIQIDGERRSIYCVKLKNSDWYLLTFMHYGTLNETIQSFSKKWSVASAVCILVIVGLLLWLFVVYYKMTRRQIEAIENAKEMADNARVAAEKANKAKSIFLSNISHDIRTPMNAITGMASIATTNIDNTAQVRECLRKISISGKQLIGIINNVLDMSKIESGKMTLNKYATSLRDIMDSNIAVIQSQINLKNQTFDVYIHDIVEENICCDSVRLNQIILNILSNAVKFTPERGAISIELFETPSTKGEKYVCVNFIFKDNGIGMSPEFRETIFDSFTREDTARVNRTEGTGLGLAITKYLIDAMGGTIEVNSIQNVGTEFRVTLDFEVSEEARTEEEMKLPDWHILVVDDDRRVCEDTVKLLTDMGARAEWVLDGDSALRMIEHCTRRDDKFDIVLLDWRLQGMDGIETAQEIRTILSENIPILLASAYDWDFVEKEAKKAGINDFVSKPLFKSTLYYSLRAYASPDSTAPKQEDQGGDFTGRKLLIAEDNELNCEIAEELLSELGFEMTWAENGKVCVELFCESKIGQYDAIIMDIRMPIMSGYEAAKAIRELDRADAKDIPIVAMTADAFAEDIKKCKDCGMDAHIAKPIDLREIERVMQNVLRNSKE